MHETKQHPKSCTFAQLITLLAPEVGGALLPVARRQRLIESCRKLPPLTDGALGFALANDASIIRIQQRAGQGSSDVDHLRRYLAQGSHGLFAETLTLRLNELLAAWQKQNSSLHNTLTELWLEYEVGDGSVLATPTVQSLLFGLSQSFIAPDEGWFAIQGAFDTLLPNEWRAWRDTIVRVMAACPPQAYVSHVAVHWQEGRPRLQMYVKQLRTQMMARYLRYVNWPGDIDNAVACAEQLRRFAEHLVVRLDIDAEIALTIGYECSMTSQSPTEPRWASLLDDLVQQALCSDAKRDAFLAWAGMTTPLLTDYDWPDRLIVESLAHPANHFSVLQRRYESIKVDVSAGGEVTAYGALRFVPQWLRL